MKMHTTLKYALVSGSYWIANVFLVGYANVAMGFRGLDSFQIGIAFSGGAGMAILFQMLSAFFMDRYPTASVKGTIGVIAAITLAMTLLLLKGELSPWTVIALYMVVLGAEMALDSVIYTMGVPGVLLAQGVQGIAFSLYNLSSSCFVNESILQEDVAKGQAVIGIAVRGAGGILANILGGYLIAASSAHTALNLCLVLTLISTAIITGAALYSGKKDRKGEGSVLC